MVVLVCSVSLCLLVYRWMDVLSGFVGLCCDFLLHCVLCASGDLMSRLYKCVTDVVFVVISVNVVQV